MRRDLKASMRIRDFFAVSTSVSAALEPRKPVVFERDESRSPPVAACVASKGHLLQCTDFGIVVRNDGWYAKRDERGNGKSDSDSSEHPLAHSLAFVFWKD